MLKAVAVEAGAGFSPAYRTFTWTDGGDAKHDRRMLDKGFPIWSVVGSSNVPKFVGEGEDTDGAFT
jgi:hypothetical protein